MFDMHAHLVPGVDDGSRSLEESLFLIDKMRHFGFRALIATPHYYPDSRPDKADRIRASFGEMKEEALKRWPELRLELGQELYYHSGLIEDLRNGRALTMCGTDAVLVEFEPSETFRNIYAAVRNLNAAGYRVILAHFERYEALRAPGRLTEIRSLDLVFQMNYESLKGGLFDREARWCRKAVKDGFVDFLGTDLHRRDYRAPEIGDVLSWLRKNLSAGAYYRLTGKNIEAFLWEAAREN